MKISELVELLVIIKTEHGDLDVETTRHNGERVPAGRPSIDHRAILKGRERSPCFLSRFYSESEKKVRTGEKVCRL